MRAGKLDRRVTIRRFIADAPNEFNEALGAWTDVATVWAQQRPNRGSERFAGGQIGSAAVMTFHIRHRADLTALDRIVFDGCEYEIIAPPRELGRRVVTEIDCVARAD